MTKQELKVLIQSDIRAVYNNNMSFEDYKKFHQKITKKLYQYKKEAVQNSNS